MFDWVQTVLTAILRAIEALKAELNPFTWINSIAEYVASFLPLPNPDLQVILDTAVAAVSLVSYYISLFDYFVNMPVVLVVIGAMLVTETVINVTRAWKFLRAFVF